jgi:signal peptidase II
MKKPWNHWLGWTAVLVVAADWCTKFWIQNQVALYTKVSIIDGWLYFIHLQNRGIAFSILNESNAVWRTPLLIVSASIVLIVLARVARTVQETSVRFGVALVAGGAVGNLGDRIANGGVTDFISVDFFPYVFNIADAAIAIGAVLLTIGLARPVKEPVA